MTTYTKSAAVLHAEAEALERQAAQARLTEARAQVEQLDKDIKAQELADLRRRYEHQKVLAAEVAELGDWQERDRLAEQRRVRTWRKNFDSRRAAMHSWDEYAEGTRLARAEQAVAWASTVHDMEIARQQQARLARSLAQTP